MAANSRITVAGRAQFLLRKADGQTKAWEETNLIVTSGLAMLAGIIATSTTARPATVAMASSNVQTTATMIALQGTELDRVNLTVSQVGNSLTYTGTLGPGLGSSQTVGEIGIFNATASGTMLNRLTSQSFTMGIGDELDVDWAISFVGED